MSENYQPKVGDRVRVVLEGEVTYVNASGFDINEGPFFSTDATEVVSVEKVAPPLPTTPGSVIRSSLTGTTAVRTASRWVDLGIPADTYFEPKGSSWAVIFDAGAAK